MAAKNWILSKPVTGKVIELRSGSEVLVVNEVYNFSLPTLKGVLINQKDYRHAALDGTVTTYQFEKFAAILPKLAFKVKAVLGVDKYIIEYLSDDRLLNLPLTTIPLSYFTRGEVTYFDEDSQKEVTYMIPTRLYEVPSLVGILDERCLNYTPLSQTDTGFTGECILNPDTFIDACTDGRAWNSLKTSNQKSSLEVYEASCKYDYTGFESEQALLRDPSVNAAARNGFNYIDIVYGEISYGVYQLGLGISPYLTGVTGSYWDLSYDPAVGFDATDGYDDATMPTVTLAPGTHVIAVQVDAAGGTSFIDSVTIIVSPNLSGCTDPNASNYNVNATVDDGSCIAMLKGCMDDGTSFSNTYYTGGFPVVQSVVPAIPGQAASNYNSAVTQHSPQMCTYKICTDAGANNYKNPDDIVNTDPSDGTTFPLNQTVQVDPTGPCTYEGQVNGCTDPGISNASFYNPGNIYNTFTVATTTGSTAVGGNVTMDPDNSHWNFNPHANTQSGRCIPKFIGCLDPLASNYVTPTGNPDIDVNWHIPSMCEYSACSDSSADNQHHLDGGATATDITVAGVDDWGYKADGSSWSETEYWIAEDLGTNTTLTTSSAQYNEDNTLCTFDVGLDDICGAGSPQILEDAVSQALQSNQIGYNNTAVVVGTYAGQLDPSTGNACLSQLTATQSATVAGISYQQVTQEKVFCQVISASNPVLYLTNPEINGTIVWNYTGSTGGGADINITNISDTDASNVSNALTAANYNNSLSPTAYYYFRVISAEDDPVNGLTLSRDFGTNPIIALFDDANITKVGYQQGSYYYVPGGAVSNFQAGDSNIDIPIGFAVGTDSDGNILSSTQSGAGGGGNNCSHATIDNGTAAAEPMYTIYRVEVANMCAYTALNFVIDADLSNVPDEITINNTPVFEGSSVGCTDPTATNYNSSATSQDLAANYMFGPGLPYTWPMALSDGYCYIEGCVDEYYTAADPSNNLIVSSSLISGTDIPLQVGIYMPDLGGYIYRIYNGEVWIVSIVDLGNSAEYTYDGALGAVAAYDGGGFNDWELPDAENLVAIYNNVSSPTSRVDIIIDPDEYWSSTLHSEGYAHTYNFASGPTLTTPRIVSYETQVRAVRSVPLSEVIDITTYNDNCGSGINQYGCTDPAASNYVAGATASPIVGDISSNCTYGFHIEDWTEGTNNYNDQIIALGYTDTVDEDGTVISTASENFANGQLSYSEQVGYEPYGTFIIHYSSVHAWNHPTKQGVILPSEPTCLSDRLVPFIPIQVSNGTPSSVTADPNLNFGYNQDGGFYTNRVQVIGKKDSNTDTINYTLYATNPELDSQYFYQLQSGSHLASNESTYLLGNSTSSILGAITSESAHSLAEQFASAGYVSSDNGGFTRKSNHAYYFRFDKNLSYSINPNTGLDWTPSEMLNDLFGNTNVFIKDMLGDAYWPALNFHNLNSYNVNSLDPQSNLYYSDDADYQHLSFGNFLSSRYDEPTTGNELITDYNFPDNNGGGEWTVVGATAVGPITFVDSGGGDYVARRTSTGNAITGLQQQIAVTPGKKYSITYKKKVNIAGTDTSYFDYAKTYVEIVPDGTNYGEAIEYAANQYFTDGTEQTVTDTFTYVGSATSIYVVLYLSGPWEGDITEFSIKQVDEYPDGYITQEFRDNTVACNDAKTPGYYLYQLIPDGSLDTYDFSPYFEYQDEVSGCMDDTALNYNSDATLTQGNYNDCLYYLTSCDGTNPEITVTPHDDTAVNGVGCAQAYDVTVNACPSVISNAQISIVLGQLQTNNTNSDIALPNGDILPALQSVYVPVLQIVDIEPCIEGIQQDDSPAVIASFTYDPTSEDYQFASISNEANISYITGGVGIAPNSDITYSSQFQIQYDEYYTDPDGNILFGGPNEISYEFSDSTLYNDNSLISPIIDGCTTVESFNYNPNATCDDGSCLEYVYGCTNPLAFNYNSDANTNDGTCIPYVYGCTDTEATNYTYNVNEVADNTNLIGTSTYGDISSVSSTFGPFPNASTNYDINTSVPEVCFYCPNLLGADGSTNQINVEYASDDTLPSFSNLRFTWNSNINSGDSSLSAATDVTVQVTIIYEEFSLTTAVEDGNTIYTINEYDIVSSVTDTEMYSYDQLEDGIILEYFKMPTTSTATRIKSLEFTAYYNPGPNGVNRCLQKINHVVDHSLYPNFLLGCTDSTAFNYYDNSDYTSSGLTTGIFVTDIDGNTTEINVITPPNSDNGLICQPVVEGCIDATADNYNAAANTDNGSCLYSGCTNNTASNYNPQANVDDGSCIIYGCTQSWGVNYNADATDDDGSCKTYGCTDATAYNTHWCLDASDPCFSNNSYTSSAIHSTTCYYQGCMDAGNGVNQPVINLANEFASESTSTYTLNDVLANVPAGITHNMNNQIAEVVSAPGNPGEQATNYSASNTISGTCYYEGCTDPNASNYEPNATTNDGTCVYEACIDETASNYGEGVTVTGNASEQTNIQNTCLGPNLLAPANSLNFNYWHAGINANIVQVNPVRIETNPSYVSGNPAARVVLSPFNPQITLSGGSLTTPSTYSILEYDETAGTNSAGVATTILYPEVAANSDVLVYNYNVQLSVQSVASGTTLTVRIKEYKNVTDINDLNVSNWGSSSTLPYTETGVTTLIYDSVSNLYIATGWTPHYQTELVVLEMSNLTSGDSVKINNITLARETCSDVVLTQEWFNGLVESGLNVSLDLDNAEALIPVGGLQNNDPYFITIRKYFNEALAYTTSWGGEFNLNPNNDLMPGHTGATYFPDASNETWRRTWFVGDNMLRFVKITPEYVAKFKVSEWPYNPMNIADHLIPAPFNLDEPRVVLSQSSVTYGTDQLYRLDFKARLTPGNATSEKKSIGVSDYVGTETNQGGSTWYYSTEVNHLYSESGVYNAIPNNQNNYILESDWVEYTVYWYPTSNSNGIALYNYGQNDNYEFEVKHIRIERVVPSVYNTTTDTCYIFGCGASGLYPVGHANEGQPWATNYSADVNSEIGIEVAPGTVGPNNELPCELAGCMTPGMDNYNEFATYDDGSCYKYGCMDSGLIEADYSPYPAPITLEEYLALNPDNGALDFTPGFPADNYDALATINQVSDIDSSNPCLYTGCTDSSSFNYSSLYTTTDNSTCIDIVSGCSDRFAANYNPNVNTESGTCCLQLLGTDADNDGVFELQNNIHGHSITSYTYSGVSAAAKPILFELVNYDCVGDADVDLQFKSGYNVLPDNLLNSDGTPKVGNITINAYPESGGTIDDTDTTFPTITKTWSQLQSGPVTVDIYNSAPTVLAVYIRVQFTYSNYSQSSEDGENGTSCTYSVDLHLDSDCASVSGCTDDGWNTTAIDGFNALNLGFPQQDFNPNVNLHVSSDCDGAHVLGCMDEHWAIPANQHVGEGASTTQTSWDNFNYNIAATGNDIQGNAYDGYSATPTINMYDDTYLGNSTGSLYGTSLGAYHPIYADLNLLDDTDPESAQHSGTPSPNTFEGSVYGCFPKVYGCTNNAKFNWNNWYHAGNINPTTGTNYTGTEFGALNFGTQYHQDPTINPNTNLAWTFDELVRNEHYLYNVNTAGTTQGNATDTCFNVVGGCTDSTAANFVTPSGGSATTTEGALAASEGLGSNVNTENNSCCYDASDLPADVDYPFSVTPACSTLPVVYDTNIYNTLDFTSGWSNLTSGTAVAIPHATSVIFATTSGFPNVYVLDALANLDVGKRYEITITGLVSSGQVTAAIYCANEAKVAALSGDPIADFVADLTTPNNGTGVGGQNGNSFYETVTSTQTFITPTIQTGFKDIILLLYGTVNSATFAITNIDIKEWKHPSHGVTTNILLDSWPELVNGVIDYSQITSITAETQNASSGAIYNSGSKTLADFQNGVDLYTYIYNDAASNAETSGTYNSTYNIGGTNNSDGSFVDPNLATKIVYTINYNAENGSACSSNAIVVTKNIGGTGIASSDTRCSTVYGCIDNTYLQFYLNNNAGNASAINNFTWGDSHGATIDNGSCTTVVASGCVNANYVEAYPNKQEALTPNWASEDTEFTEFTNTQLFTPEGNPVYGFLGTIGTSIPAGPSQTYPNVVTNISNVGLCEDEIIYGCVLDHFAEYWGAQSTPSNSNTIFGINSNQGSFISEANNIKSWANVSLENDPSNALSGVSENHALLLGCGNLTTPKIGCVEPVQYVDYTYPGATSITTNIQTSWCNYDPLHNIKAPANSNNDCQGLIGCVDPAYIEFDGISTTSPAANITNVGDAFSCNHLGSYLNNYITNYTGTLFSSPHYPEHAVSLSINPCGIESIPGCTDSDYVEYNPDANVYEQGACQTIIVQGCTDTNYCEYYTGAQNIPGIGVIHPTVSIDGACQTSIGCTNPLYLEAYNENYDATNLELTGDAVYGTPTNGCTSFTPSGISLATFLSSNPNNTVQQYQNAGCTTPIVVGCTDNTKDENGNNLYLNYNPNANLACYDGETYNSCCFEAIPGCTDGSINELTGNLNYVNFNSAATLDDGSCIPAIEGCTQSGQFGFDVGANLDNGSCLPVITGCLNETFPYNGTDTPSANQVAGYDPTDPNTITYPNTHLDSECFPIIEGCTDPTAMNYNNIGPVPTDPIPLDTSANANFINVNTDNNTCLYILDGCMDPCANNYDPNATVSGTCFYTAGCTDSQAYNYEPDTNQNDGSCLYCEDWSATTVGSPYIQVTDNTSFINGVSSEDGAISITPISTSGVTTGYSVRWYYSTPDNSVQGQPLPQYNDAISLTGLAPGYYSFELYSSSSPNCAPGSSTQGYPAVQSHVHSGVNCSFDEGEEQSYVVSPGPHLQFVLVLTDGVGCTDSAGIEYSHNSLGELNLTAEGGTFNTYTPGASTTTTLSASNYDSFANVDDGNCVYPGCTDPSALNYSASATVESGTCIYIQGCQDPLACNYNPEATVYGPCSYKAIYRDCNGVCLSGEVTDSNPLGESLQFPGLCPEQVLSDCIDTEAINFQPVVNQTRVIPGGSSQRMRIVTAPVAIEDDGSCVYENPCIPTDIYDIIDALADTVNDQGRTVLTNLRTGMLDPADVATMWTLMLVDYVVNKVGFDGFYNCAGYNYEGQVTYTEGVDSTNYFDKFLTFAFKQGDEHFAGVQSNRSRALVSSASNMTKQASRNALGLNDVVTSNCNCQIICTDGREWMANYACESNCDECCSNANVELCGGSKNTTNILSNTSNTSSTTINVTSASSNVSYSTNGQSTSISRNNRNRNY